MKHRDNYFSFAWVTSAFYSSGESRTIRYDVAPGYHRGENVQNYTVSQPSSENGISFAYTSISVTVVSIERGTYATRLDR